MNRRRWLWLIVAVILFAAGGRIAWEWRPLTATERALVGSWKCENEETDTEVELSFGANRRFTSVVRTPSSGKETTWVGSWTASNEIVFVSVDEPGPRTLDAVLARAKRWLSRADRPERHVVKFDGDSFSVELIDPPQSNPGEPPRFRRVH